MKVVGQIVLLIVLLSVKSPVCAQDRKTCDTILMIRDYIREVNAAVPRDSGALKIKRPLLKALLSQGTSRRYMLERQLHQIEKDNNNEQEQVLRSYNFLLQSVILLLSDLKELPFSHKSVQDEIRYLNTHIPLFINKMNYYISLLQNRLKHPR